MIARAVALAVLIGIGTAGAQEVGFIGGVVIEASRTPSRTRTPTLAPPTITPTRQPCPGDINQDGLVTINEIVQAVNALLEGCP